MLKPTSILDQRQLSFLEQFARSNLKEHFYLTGGTALCGFYIPYRYSEDLDFFTEEEIPIEVVTTFMKSVQSSLGFDSYEVQKAFNRNLIFLNFEDKKILKTEFTYFPFPPKGSFNVFRSINVDNIEDIALNKIFTIYQKPRLRDFMDLYKILQKKNFSFEKLISDSKIKFDWHIDPLQLGSQLLKVRERKDKPRVVEGFDYSTMEKFFLKIANELGNDVIEN